MENITHLDLSNSRVSHITDGVMRSILMNLKTLKLTNNVIRSLPLSIQKTEDNTKLWISNNSYDCNCDMMWMRDWLVKATNVMDKEDITCTSGKMIGSMHDFIMLLTLRLGIIKFSSTHYQDSIL